MGFIKNLVISLEFFDKSSEDKLHFQLIEDLFKGLRQAFFSKQWF